MEDEIGRLGRLLDGLRALSSRDRFNFRTVDLAAVISDALTAEMPVFAAADISVVKTVAVDLPEIVADGDKIKQVLLNLCKNAVDAMVDGGTLTVSARRSGDHVVLVVSDTGGGIPEGIEIFESFTTTKPEGMGLGLAIVDQIVRGHRGEISHTSEPGRGTTFTVTLPLARSS